MLDETQRVRDVVICGGGLAGLLLARLVRREFPAWSVTVIERTRRPLPEASHKVGESAVELASQYLERLGLGEYLLERHFVKFGLRFYPGGGELPLAARTEIGGGHEPIVRSWQLDRGRLEQDLRDRNEADGIELIEGARVLDVELGEGGAQHVVVIDADGGPRRLAARWVVDATGRAAVLRRKLKLTRGSPHSASASWFRIAGRLDINDLVPASERAWHERQGADRRWRSTNHLMGRGYWAWIIPLATGNTSIGIVIHDEVHDFHDISSLERSRDFLRRHEPVLAGALEERQVLDFLCLKGYSHGVARAWAADRWALVGDAGAFVDPLYSPGSDFIAIANSFTVEMLRTEAAGGSLAEKAEQLNNQYRHLVNGSTDVFRQAAPVYGHAHAMAAKVYWDNFAYWSFPCQYIQQEIYRLGPAQHAPFTVVGRRFVELSNFVQHLLRTWAELAPQGTPEPVYRQLPLFPSVLVEAHIAVAQRMTPDETLAYMRIRADQGVEIVGELVLRVVQELGPELGRQLLDTVEFERWNVGIPRERLEMESRAGLVRRRGLSPIARDVAHSLGKVSRHAGASRARELLGRG
jgi:flavin-dependent dehydrogenase